MRFLKWFTSFFTIVATAYVMNTYAINKQYNNINNIKKNTPIIKQINTNFPTTYSAVFHNDSLSIKKTTITPNGNIETAIEIGKDSTKLQHKNKVTGTDYNASLDSTLKGGSIGYSDDNKIFQSTIKYDPNRTNMFKKTVESFDFLHQNSNGSIYYYGYKR
ncbi:MAG: hypothetical protein QXK76_02145 [Candidatus Woesearchaeota archaeon]